MQRMVWFISKASWASVDSWFYFQMVYEGNKHLTEHSVLKSGHFLISCLSNLITVDGSTVHVACVFLSASSSEECVTLFINVSYLSILIYLMFYLMKFLTFRLSKLFEMFHPSCWKSAQ